MAKFITQQIAQLINNWIYGENSRENNRAKHYAGKTTTERFAILSQVLPDGTKVFGIDVSHWNVPPVDFQRMKALYNIQFVMIKGCDGSVNTRYYLEHVASAKAAGLLWGMYVWLYPASKVNMDAQVAAWHARAQADPPPMGIFIDCEWTSYNGIAANPNANDLRLAHDKLKALEGKSSITYTAQGYADSYLAGFDWSREELWIANYGVSEPALPNGAVNYTYWQFTSTLPGKEFDPNGNPALDGNYFNGTQAQFNARYGGTVAPPPTGEPPMPTTPGKAQELQGKTPSIKSIPDVSGAKVGALLPYSKTDFIELVNGSTVTTDKWLKLAEGKYVNQKVGGVEYMRILSMPVVTPPPVEPPTAPTLPVMPVTITLGDDITYARQTTTITLQPLK